MILAVEIGGTKLQSALVDEQGQVSRPQRDIIDRAAGAAGILEPAQVQLAAARRSTLAMHQSRFRRSGVGRRSHLPQPPSGGLGSASIWLVQTPDRSPLAVVANGAIAAMGEAL
ncbi:MAG: hypothetical protein R3B96_25085 [Pirellulaceae bacterium]